MATLKLPINGSNRPTERDTTSTLTNNNADSHHEHENGTGDGQVDKFSPRYNHKEPLRSSGALNQFEHFDATPSIGTEFPNAKLVDWMNASNSDDLIRDLAITVSERGVVFFRSQDDLDIEHQKVLAQRLGELSGKPKTSSLHIHPVNNAYSKKDPTRDDHITLIGDAQSQAYANHFMFQSGKKQTNKSEWHSDITFEQVPCDYAVLRMSQLPSSGGDTMWASGYEVYDRISPPYQSFLETLTCTFTQPQFNAIAAKGGFPLFEGPRGAPENIGSDLSAIHPVVRTNPVTGWKSIFSIGIHAQQINRLEPQESTRLLDNLLGLIVENHDLQVRHKWRNANDVAIWDNRSAYHAATHDFEGLGLGPRAGQRATSLGERPYFDPHSQSRREYLMEKAKAERKRQELENQ